MLPAELPYHLGLCRSCNRMEIRYQVDLYGQPIRRVYYCKATMHLTDGKTICNDYQGD